MAPGSTSGAPMQIQSRRAGFLSGAVAGARVGVLLSILALLMVMAFGLAPGALAQDGGALGDDLAEACAAGDGAACLTLGERLYAAPGQAADMAGALALFGQACERGHGAACFRLGGELEFPDFGEADTGGALAAYTQACELGLAEGCDRAGIETSDPPAEEEMEGPLPPAAPAGEVSSDTAIVVGVAAARTEDTLSGFASEALPDLDFGMEIAGLLPAPLPGGADEAVAADMAAPDEADEEALLAEERRAMGEACGRGEMEACELFAAWLRDGTGGAEDSVRARRIFSVICTEGSVKGCYELGWMMYDAGLGSGSGLDTDELEISRARFLFSETCKAGVIEACIQGADMRRNGVGGRVDVAGAGRLYAIACEAGLDIGCLMAAPEEAVAEAAAAERDVESGAEVILLEDDASAE